VWQSTDSEVLIARRRAAGAPALFAPSRRIVLVGRPSRKLRLLTNFGPLKQITMSVRSMDDTDVLLSELSARGVRDTNEVPARKLFLAHQHSSPIHADVSRSDEVPKGWPTRAQRVKNSPFKFVSTIIIDFLLLTLSTGFLAFALYVRHYDQAHTVEHPQAKRVLLALSRVGPSVFPLLFAATIGRLIHAVLLWRLEKGARIGLLDLLAGSTSLTATITSQLQLRTISVVSVILLLIWISSPIGGQASIRQLGFGNATSEDTFALAYLQPRSAGGLGGLYDTSTYRLKNLQLANALFLAALLSPIESRNSTVDLWNNVKIPLLETYEHSSTADIDGWYNASDMQPTYSSLIGVPVSINSQQHDATSVFIMRTSYFHLDCPLQEQGQSLTHGSNFSGPGAAFYLNYDAGCGTSRGGDGYDGQTGGSLGNGSCLPPSGAYLDIPNDPNGWGAAPNLENTFPRNFTYFSRSTNYSTFCRLTNASVEAEIECSSGAPCRATRIRRSRDNLTGAAYTVLDELGGFGFDSVNGNWGLFLGAFLNVLGGPPSYGGPLQMYVADPDEFLSAIEAHQPSTELFAIRQGQLMNALWTCLSNFPFVTTYATSTAFADINATVTSTTVTTTKTFEIVVCHYNWMITLAITSSMLILASLIHPIIRLLLSRCPELMLNISSLATRESSRIDVPNSGTALDCSERARLLQHLKVRFGDVGSKDDVGRLAIASVDDADLGKVRGVVKRRLYA
jgi:hypothetical protein